MPRNIVKKYVKDNIPKLTPETRIIDVGAGEEPNYYEHLFPGCEYHKFDQVQNKDKTIGHVYDLYNLPDYFLGKYDIVLCLEVLEHVPDPFAAVRACASLAKPGGLVILSSVTCWAIHRHPKDYWRFLPDSFDLLIEKSGLKKLEVKLEQVDASTQGGIFAKALKPSN